MSIKGKLIILFLVFSLIPMAVISIYSTNKAGKALADSGELYLKSKVENFAINIEQEIGNRNVTRLIKRAMVQNAITKAKKEKYYTNGFLALLNTSGEIVYHPHKEELGENISEKQYFKNALQKKEGIYKYTDSSKEEKISALEYNKELDLIMWAIVPREEVVQAADNIMSNLYWAIFGIGVVLVLIAFYFANSIAKPINSLTSNIKDLSDDLDLTSFEIDSLKDRNDEIGTLSDSFDKMINKWKDVLLNVRQVGKNLLESSAQLAEASDDSSAASEEVSASIEEVASRASDQTNYLSVANDNIKELMENLENSSDLGKEALNLANSTREQAGQGQESVNNVVTQMGNINEVIEQISEVVNNLVDKSSQIGEIVNLIDSIANQTQLLALNAAIEAARAGEAGQGFSVVADEIKQLAEESIKSANQIKELIQETQDEASKASEAMQVGKKEVKTGSKVVDEAGVFFKEIFEASDVNLEGTKETMEALNSAIDISDKIIDKVHEVAGIAEETSASAEEVSASTEEQTATMEQVSSSATTLKEMAIELENLISVFKLEK